MNQNFLRRPRLHPPFDRSKGNNLDRIAPSQPNQTHVRNSSWRKRHPNAHQSMQIFLLDNWPSGSWLYVNLKHMHASNPQFAAQRTSPAFVKRKKLRMSALSGRHTHLYPHHSLLLRGRRSPSPSEPHIIRILTTRRDDDIPCLYCLGPNSLCKLRHR